MSAWDSQGIVLHPANRLNARTVVGKLAETQRRKTTCPGKRLPTFYPQHGCNRYQQASTMHDCNTRDSVHRFTPATGARRTGQLAACKLRHGNGSECGGCPCESRAECPFPAPPGRRPVQSSGSELGRGKEG